MTTTTKTSHDTSLVEAASVNAKLGASVIVSAAGCIAGMFVSAADSASNHAAKNPDGMVSHALRTTLKDQYSETRAMGYQLMEDAKDVVDFSKVSPKGAKDEDAK